MTIAAGHVGPPLPPAFTQAGEPSTWRFLCPRSPAPGSFCLSLSYMLSLPCWQRSSRWTYIWRNTLREIHWGEICLAVTKIWVEGRGMSCLFPLQGSWGQWREANLAIYCTISWWFCHWPASGEAFIDCSAISMSNPHPAFLLCRGCSREDMPPNPVFTRNGVAIRIDAASQDAETGLTHFSSAVFPLR